MTRRFYLMLEKSKFHAVKLYLLFCSGNVFLWFGAQMTSVECLDLGRWYSPTYRNSEQLGSKISRENTYFVFMVMSEGAWDVLYPSLAIVSSLSLCPCVILLEDNSTVYIPYSDYKVIYHIAVTDIRIMSFSETHLYHSLPVCPVDIQMHHSEVLL